MKNPFNFAVILSFFALCAVSISCGNKKEESSISKTGDGPVAGYEASLIDFGSDGYYFFRKNGTEAKIANGAKVILKKIHEDQVEVSAESTDGDMVDGVIDASRISWREDAMDMFLPYYINGYKSAADVFQHINLSNQKKTQEHVYKLLIRLKELWPEWENYKNQEAEKLPENITKIIDSILFNGNFYDQESQTAIHFFAENGGANFMERFVLLRYDYSSNLNFKDQNGRTPLMAAVLAGNASVMQLLLMNGADMEIKDYSGKSAGDYVKESSSKEIRAVAEARSTTPEDFSTLISILKKKQIADCMTNGIYLKIPFSLWQRYEKTGQKISVKSDIHEFYTELSLLEEIGAGEEIQDEDNQIEEKTSGQDQDDGHEQTAYIFSGAIKTSIMSDCKSDSELAFELTDGTEVQILERNEVPETLDDVTDWWYKIKSGEQEGWCFGGNLFHPYYPEDIESIEKDKDILKQKDFEKNKIYKAVCNSEIICKDGKTVPVKIGNYITILSAVEDCMDYSSSSLGKCKYYVVQGPEFDVGIMSGAFIAHKEVEAKRKCDGNTKWFLSLYSGSGKDWYADVGMVDYDTGKDMHFRFNRDARFIGEHSLIGDSVKLQLGYSDVYDMALSEPDDITICFWKKIETPPEWIQELGKAGDYYVLGIAGTTSLHNYDYDSDNRSVSCVSAWCVNENGWANEIVNEKKDEWYRYNNDYSIFRSYSLWLSEYSAGYGELQNTIAEFVVYAYDCGRYSDDWDGTPVEYTDLNSYRYDRTVPCTYKFSGTDHWDFLPEW